MNNPFSAAWGHETLVCLSFRRRCNINHRQKNRNLRGSVRKRFHHHSFRLQRTSRSISRTVPCPAINCDEFLPRTLHGIHRQQTKTPLYRNLAPPLGTSRPFEFPVMTRGVPAKVGNGLQMQLWSAFFLHGQFYRGANDGWRAGPPHRVDC